jgi:hypothetical protein
MGTLESLAVEYGVGVVREYVLKRLQDLSLEDVTRAVEEWDVDVWRYMGEKEQEKARRWASRFRKYKDIVTGDNVLSWIWEESRMPEGVGEEEKARRSHFRGIFGVLVNSRRGREWLDAVVENLKAHLYPAVVIEPLQPPASPSQQSFS